MPDRLLVATDLDRTLIPNGPEPESEGSLERFAGLVSQPGVTLAYVSGRHRALVEEAIGDYCLPAPDYVIGDVGTSIYHLDVSGDWQRQADWERQIARDWGGFAHHDLAAMLHGVAGMQLQEPEKQNLYKLSYYVPLETNHHALSEAIRARLATGNIRFRLVWSIDEAAGTGLLDILPKNASKRHAIEALMATRGFDLQHTIFCGDSGNDLEVLASPIRAVLVGNASPDVRALALKMANDGGHESELYIASGGFMGLNGNYSAGMLEGIAHYHPDMIPWMTATNG